MNDAPANERLVSREEKPVELAAPSAAVPRVVLPSPMTNSAFPPAPSPAGAAPASPTPSTTGSAPANPAEPKKIRTVTIKPDGNEAGARSIGSVQPSPAAQVSARSVPGAPAAKPPAARRAPLSLDPQAQAEAVEAAPAAAPPPARARNPAPAPRVASIAPAGESGGYMVQISSQRSESEAHASFRSLQGKFKELAGREAVVRRADLGSKGTYYRAMVGPFGSSDEAGRFCGNLKAAGGQCIIQKN
jgi:cell division protein FtsN